MNALSIEGSYRFVRRELPDGTAKFPPTVKGMFTYTKDYRNFSILWKDNQGRHYSECYVARYTLTDTEYSETPEYLITDDQIQGTGVRYDLSNSTADSLVSREGKRIRFDLPQPFEKALSITVEFEGTQLVARAKDQFVDYWERVA